MSSATIAFTARIGFPPGMTLGFLAVIGAVLLGVLHDPLEQREARERQRRDQQRGQKSRPAANPGPKPML